MIRVLLVEDEPPVMRMFKTLLENHNQNFVVVATAINGKRALEVLENENIDVVFADIKMPVMDGLQLASEIQKQYPNIYTILVSGYQDFEYAHKALQYRVFDYLLKPVSKDSLGILLDKLEVAVNAFKKENKRKNVMKAINEDVPSQEAGANADCIALLICAGAFPLSSDDSMLPSRAFWDNVDIEAVIEKILNSSQSLVFNGKTSSEKVVVIEMGNIDDGLILTEKLYILLNEIGSLPITIASLDHLISINGISDALRVLRQRLYSGICLCRPTLLITEKSASSKNKAVDTVALSQGIVTSVNKQDKELIKKSLIDAFGKLYETETTQLEAVSFLKGLTSLILSEPDPFDQALLALHIEIEDAISNAVDFNSLSDDLASIFLGIKSNSIKPDAVPTLIQNVEDYLKKNYSSPITNTVLSHEFGFVPSYLSKLFKAYMGLSPAEYLTHYRIDKAKKLMKAQPDLMMKEIASLVGINDQYYFSKLFKKETGQWPTEFVE